MAKQLNVNLAFTADTSKAKQQIQDLQNQLTKFLNQPMSSFGDALTKDIKEASKAAAELKVHLEKATNPNTGTLDFSKLNQSMKQANTSISQYAAKIRDMGPEGQKSFMMLAQSVAAAEVPIRRSNALLDEMWTTMKNTMRWQISSSILHGFMGAISSATGYAKDLNESLNNIRIVTGQSVDQMARFAENANKAAKALSTTTTEYTNAALIYYQQGLSDQDVLARTDITVKMANVAGESAQKVSDQLTAVWNNFYDGSKSLEYYADVMTALGAATASSTDEISEGLNKFAAVAETVGLSYEYAASALATVTATTRQSADVVGTAFKTLFARIQDLELGKTLDDGTSLGKYSAALAAVGVNIKDSNGGLKEMDQILEEMAAKWNTLSKDQQVSLAQTVAGVRQYTQLIALMDNWDFMQENLATSYGSTGALQEQADIYEESWQAASDRVRAALEEIYATLIDDEAFIDILNAVEKIIKGFDTLIDAAGGLKGVIFTLGTVLTNVFSKQLSDSIINLGYNLQNLTESGRAKIQAQKTQEMQNMLGLIQGDEITGEHSVGETTKIVLSSQLEDQIRLTEQAKNLSEIEQVTLQYLLDQKKARGDLAIKAAEELKAARSVKDEAWADLRGSGISYEDIEKIGKQVRAVEKARAAALSNQNDESLGEDLVNAEEDLEELLGALGRGEKAGRAFADATRNVVRAERQVDQATEDARQEIDLNTRSTQQNTAAQQQNTRTLKLTSKEFVSLASGTMGLISAISSLGSAFDTISDPNLTGWEKFSRIAASLGGTFLLLSNSLNHYNKTLGITERISAAVATAKAIHVAAIEKELAIDKVAYTITNLQNTATQKEMALELAELLIKSGLIKEKQKDAFISTLLEKLKNRTNNQTLKSIVLETLETFTKKKLNAETLRQIVLNNALLLKFAAIAAAIGAVVFVVSQLIKAYNADATAAKNAAKSAEELKNVLNEAKDAYDNLKSSIEDYKESESAIAKLKEGTLEWKQAVLETNNQVLSLLEKYPELSKYVSKTGDLLSIDEKGLEEVLNKELETLNRVSMMSYSANVHANEAKTKSDITNTARSIIYYTTDESGSTFHQATSSDISAAIEALENATGEQIGTYEGFASLMEKQGIVDSDLITALYSNKESLIELSNTIGSRDLANDIYKQQIASNYMSTGENKAFYEGLSNIGQEAIDKAIAENILNKYTSVGGTKKSRAEEYAELMGIDAQSIKIKNGAATFTLEDGSTKVIDNATITQGLMNNQLLTDEDAKEKIAAYQNIITKSNTALGTGGGENILAALTDDTFDINNLTEAQINKIKGDGENYSILKALGLSKEDLAAAGISNADEFIKGFSDKIASWDPEVSKKLAEERDKAEALSILEKGAATYDLDLEVLKIQAERIREVNAEAELTAAQAAEVAVQNQRLNKGVEELSENWEDWSNILANSDKDTMEYAETTAKLTKVVKELVGATGDFELPSDFFEMEENLDLIEKAARGDIKAINELGAATAKASVSMAEVSSEFLQAGIDAALAQNAEADTSIITDNILSNFESVKQIVEGGIQNLQDAIHNGNIAMGDELGQTSDILGAEWVAALNEMAVATGMSVEEMESLLSQMGVDAKVTTTYVDQDVTVPRWTTYTSTPKYNFGEGAWSQDSWTVQTGTETMAGKVPVASISMGEGDAPAPSVKYIGNGKVSSGSVKSSGGGGGSKPKTAKPVKKSDTVERYKEVNDSIEDLQHNLDISNKKADALWGEARFKEMRKGVKILEEENELLKEKAKLADAYLAEDTAALKKAASAAGINFTFNTDGNISNYTTEMTKLWKKLDSTIASANRDGNVSDAEQERIDKLQEKVDAVKDAISQYEDTLKTKQDIDKEYLDNQKEIWDTNFDILTESLEYNLSFNEADLELIDYYLSKMEDDMFKLAEAYTKLNEKSIEYSDNLDIQRQHYEDLTESFKNGKISEAQYKEALLESQSAIVDTLQSLLDLDKEMQEYYGKTLDKTAEEIDIYSDKIDHLNSVLDHYNNIMDLTGKSKDYEAMGTILEGQAENLHNQLQIAKEEYDMYKTQAEYWEQMMASVDETDPAFEVYKKNWDAAVIATNDAQDEMLSKTQEWAEAMKAVIENELADIGQTLEKSITGGTSFDELLTSMERANSLQEEYLTDTNKIYETNKLIRTAQQEIDKTTNTVAKNKLKQFINETNQLQEQTKLSEYELKIQQAKYDLIIAEIALEEAQQAKSMVRLTRDSEGNFGYVYTADQNQIDAAQQKLEDAQNNLYNIGLEGANNYSQKYAETMQEMYDTLQEIQTAFLNGEIATQEEYDRRMLEAKEYYFDKLKDFSNLYQVALTTDSRVVNDAWSSDFNDMIYKTEELKSAVNDYADQSAGILKEWADTVKETIDGSGLDDVNQAVSGIVSDSEKLTEVLSGEDGLISKLNEEIDKVKESTSEYALKRAEIQGLISDYEKLAEQVNADYDDKNITAPETTLPSESVESKPESATGPASKTTLGIGSAVKVKAGAIWYGNSYGGGSSGRARNGTILYINESGTHPYNIDGLGWVRKEDLESFKSGGYTGAWGSYGKLALLDEKELILNKGDTSNFLASMEVLERILSIIDLHSANAQLSGVLSAPGFNHMNERSIEQNVHIEASFPGVQDRNEIEEAFNNLINQASQYANRD